MNGPPLCDHDSNSSAVYQADTSACVHRHSKQVPVVSTHGWAYHVPLQHPTAFGGSSELAKNLPHGHQRALGVALALATEPKLLLLDEPATGMNAQEISHMMGIINGIREKGHTVLLVEHAMRVVMGICDRIIVLNFGNKIAEGSPEDIQKNTDVIEAYLGVEQDVAVDQKYKGTLR